MFKRDHLFCHPCGPNNSNFGDLIGPWLYNKITGKQPFQVNAYQIKTFPQSVPLLITCGSIIKPKFIYSNSIIWGSGIMTGEIKLPRKPLAVHAVRGPLSRKALLVNGIECPEVFGDPGILAPLFYKPRKSHAYKVGLIPHYVCNATVKDLFRHRQDSVLVIDVDRPVEAVIDDIASCEVTFSSSLHGIILSHAYKIPCQWMQAANEGTIHGDNSKFHDYYMSIGRQEGEVIPEAYASLINLSVAELIEKASKSPGPTQTPKLENLLRACPF